MKRLLFLMILLPMMAFSQQQKAVPIKNVLVKAVVDDTAVLSVGDRTLKVDKLEMEESKRYNMIVVMATCASPCAVRNAIVKWYGPTEEQARKDFSDAIQLFSKADQLKE